VEHPVAQDARVVDDDIEAAKRLQGLVDHVRGPREGRDGVRVGGRLAARLLDFGHHFLRGGGVLALALAGGAQVVDDDPRPAGGHPQRDAAADPAARTCYDGDFSLEHGLTSNVVMVAPIAGGGGPPAECASV
jgi:hypothetical protein